MAYGITQSADLEATSSQGFNRADDALLKETVPFTCELWANFESFPADDSFNMMGKGSGNGYNFLFQVVSGVHRLNLVKAGVVDQNVNITTLTLATWYHLAAVQTSTQVEYFIDGVSVGTFTNSSAYLSSGTDVARIGTVGSGGLHFDGKISLVRFWQTNRTAAQLLADKCSVLGTTTSLSAEWTLNNTLNDNSGNGFTLTNVNATPFVSDFPSTCATIVSSRRRMLLGVGT